MKDTEQEETDHENEKVPDCGVLARAYGVYCGFMVHFTVHFLFFAFHLISDDNPQDGDAMLEEISSRQNVVAINRWDRMNDWKNIFALDISLKNDVRMDIADCKRDKSGQPDYADTESL